MNHPSVHDINISSASIKEYIKNPTKEQATIEKIPANLLIPPHRPDKIILRKMFLSAMKIQQETDGVDHINVSEDGKTELGRMLDMNAHTPFVHPELSSFSSVGGLSIYIRSQEKDDHLRHVWGKSCRQVYKKLSMSQVDGFKTIIAYATWFKVASNPQLTKLMIDSSLPFRSYFFFGELRVCRQPSEAVWHVRILEEIRRIIKLRKENSLGGIEKPVWPDFQFLDGPEFYVDQYNVA